MAFTTAQKRQVLRLPTVDATVDEVDAFGFLGVPQVLTTPTTPTLATSIKRQILRLPTVDAVVDEVDAYGFLGTPFPVAVGGPTIEQFTLEWSIDPTSEQVDPTFAGSMESSISPFAFNIGGEFIGPPGPQRGTSRRSFRSLRVVVQWQDEHYIFDTQDEAAEFVAERRAEIRKEMLDKKRKRATLKTINFDILERSKK